jgi:hypothetical protein
MYNSKNAFQKYTIVNIELNMLSSSNSLTTKCSRVPNSHQACSLTSNPREMLRINAIACDRVDMGIN